MRGFADQLGDRAVGIAIPGEGQGESVLGVGEAKGTAVAKVTKGEGTVADFHYVRP